MLSGQLLIFIAVIHRRKRQQARKKGKRKFWVLKIFQNRENLGAYHTLVQELRTDDRKYYYRYTRMSPERLNNLLSKVGPLITKKPCPSRSSISPAEKLMVTLRYLSTGADQQTLSFHFRLGRSTVSSILRETLEAIWTALQEDYMKHPSTIQDWIDIAGEFDEEWNFPNCVGAIDGKHIMMDCPKNSG